MTDPKTERVVLIRKNKPHFLADKLNGIGGSIEFLEGPFDAMVREFAEETGVFTIKSDWSFFCKLETRAGDIYFFFSDRLASYENCISTTTDEAIYICSPGELRDRNHVADLDWLITMGASMPLHGAKYLAIKENY